MIHNLRKGNRYCSRKCSCSCRAHVPSPHIDKKEMPKLPGLRKGWKLHLHKIILMHLISRLTTLLALNSNKHAYCTVRAVHVLCIRMICKYMRVFLRVFASFCCHSARGCRSWRRFRRAWLVSFLIPHASAYLEVFGGISRSDSFMSSQNLFT